MQHQPLTRGAAQRAEAKNDTDGERQVCFHLYYLAYIYTHIYVYRYLNVYICIYIYTYLNIYVYVYIYI